jgi:hypothetical protein
VQFQLLDAVDDARQIDIQEVEDAVGVMSIASTYWRRIAPRS